MGVAALGMASYAATFMQVKTDDGKIVRYDVEHVTEVNFVKDEIIPSDTTPLIPSDTLLSNHPYVDLGLPSGTLWATYNVGATKPEEYGDYFAWGETEPKEVYDWITYKYATSRGGFLDSITKYNMSGHYGIIDKLSVLLPEDDAATANWGKDWRMPTNEEQRELQENSYMVWTDGYNGTDVRGVIFYKAKSADDKGEFVGSWQTPLSDYSVSSDAHVFLPAAGYRCDDELGDVGGNGRFWSSSLDEYHEDGELRARVLFFYGKGVDWNNYYGGRFFGLPVRAVRTKN